MPRPLRLALRASRSHVVDSLSLLESQALRSKKKKKKKSHGHVYFDALFILPPNYVYDQIRQPEAVYQSTEASTQKMCRVDDTMQTPVRLRLAIREVSDRLGFLFVHAM
jgi:hypothetical protein